MQKSTQAFLLLFLLSIFYAVCLFKHGWIASQQQLTNILLCGILIDMNMIHEKKGD